MNKFEKKIHSWFISLLTAGLVYLFIDNFIFELELWHFIIIEICAGIGEIFSTFAKATIGIETGTKLDNLNDVNEVDE